jgi:hypothetical protein
MGDRRYHYAGGSPVYSLVGSIGRLDCSFQQKIFRVRNRHSGLVKSYARHTHFRGLRHWFGKGFRLNQILFAAEDFYPQELLDFYKKVFHIDLIYRETELFLTWTIQI